MNNLVFNGANNQVLTNSLLVAEKFGKSHKDVIRSIKELLTSAQNCANLFIESEYPDTYGRMQPMYVMNRDGFSLLVMGFTGKEALKFKMDFLEAFNKMETLLNSDDYILGRSQEILQNRLQAAHQQLQMAQDTIDVQQEQIQNLAPKAEYTDDVLQAIGTYTFTQMAKELNFTNVNTFIAHLKELSVIYKQSGQYQLTSKHSGQRYTATRTARYFHKDGTPGTSVSTVWTERGRWFLHNMFESKKGGAR